MRHLLITIFAVGCGTLEGSELPYIIPQCEVTLTPVESTADPYLTLEPLDELLSLIEGDWPVELERIDDEPAVGPFPAIIGVSLAAGPIYAADREFPPSDRGEVAPDENCEDEYFVPLDIDLTLEDGLFSLSGQHPYSIQNAPTVLMNHSMDSEEGAWWDPSRVDGSMSLKDPADGAQPEAVALSLEFEEGEWNGAVSVNTETDEYSKSRIMLRILVEGDPAGL